MKNNLKEAIKNKEIKIFKRKNGRKYTNRAHRDRFFYPKEWMKFYDNLRPSQTMTFDFLINTGARINESINVKIGDVDLINKRIILRITKVKAIKKEKNPRPRTIPISTQFSKKLNKYIKKKKLKNDDYLGLLSKPATHIALKKCLIKSNIPDWYMFSTHNIRKTLETWFMALDVNYFKITQHMGHNIITASQHYVSPDIFSFEEKKEMRLVIGDLYGR